MGELAAAWSEHIGESPITDIAVDAIAGRAVIPIEANAFATMIASEVVVIQQQILTLCQAIDDLTEVVNGHA